MKTCECGGKWWRHSKAPEMVGQRTGMRYICSKCRKSITVRNGQIVNPRERPSLIVKDWRHV